MRTTTRLSWLQGPAPAADKTVLGVLPEPQQEAAGRPHTVRVLPRSPNLPSLSDHIKPTNNFSLSTSAQPPLTIQGQDNAAKQTETSWGTAKQGLGAQTTVPPQKSALELNEKPWGLCQVSRLWSGERGSTPRTPDTHPLWALGFFSIKQGRWRCLGSAEGHPLGHARKHWALGLA